MADQEDKMERTYTQHTVAWPNLDLHEAGAVDDIGIDVDGVGSVRVTFYDFNRGDASLFGTSDRHHPACKVEFFGDGLMAFRDKRFQRVMTTWAQMGSKRDTATPAQWVKWLDREGFQPSEYHQRGSKAA